MQAGGRDASVGSGGGGIRHKLGSLFSPRGAPPPVRSKSKEETEHGIFITADVLRVGGVVY